jgi:hypothetical protein
LNITEIGNKIFTVILQIAEKQNMKDDKAEEIKALVATRLKQIKGDIPYNEISGKCHTTAARISDVANNNIDCQLTTLIDIAIGLRVHPKDLLNIDFDFKEYYRSLDGK